MLNIFHANECQVFWEILDGNDDILLDSVEIESLLLGRNVVYKRKATANRLTAAS